MKTFLLGVAVGAIAALFFGIAYLKWLLTLGGAPA